VEPNEDVRAAALREIKEETGLEVQDLRLRGVINIPTAVQDTGVLLFVFTAVAAQRNVRQSEEGALTWVSLDRAMELDLVEDLPTLLPHLVAMKPDEPPFFAHYSYDQDDRLVVTFGE
jgi:8-oxo-dGTP diphosphatase